MNFAIFGFGFIGKVHFEALKNSKTGNLSAIVDEINPNLEIPYYRTLEELQKSDNQVDTIIIATPNGLHFAHAKKALEMGYHVLIEKPITLNSQDFERLLYISEQTGKRVFNMLQLRFSPIVQWIKSALESRYLGEIYLVNTQCYWNRNPEYYQKRKWHGTKTLDGGVLFTQFSHFVDVMHFWFDELKPVDIRKFNFNHQDSTEFPDSGIINFELKNQGFGSMTYTTSTFDKNFESTITILAEKGTVQIGGQYMNQINYLHAENIENSFESEIGKAFHQPAIEEVISAIKENRKSILDAENARNVIKFLENVS